MTDVLHISEDERMRTPVVFLSGWSCMYGRGAFRKTRNTATEIVVRTQKVQYTVKTFPEGVEEGR